MDAKQESKLTQVFKGVSRIQSLNDIGTSVLAIILALIVGTILILIIGESPIKAYSTLLSGALGNKQAIANTISKTIPLIFTGLSVAIASRSSMLNIGAEGQLHFGAMMSIIFALAFPGLNKWILLPLVFIVGMAGGAFAGAIPGYFRAKLKINEVIVCIMLNYIFTLFTSFLVNGPFKSEGTVAQTEMISENARLSKLIPRTQLTTAVFIAIGVAILLYIFLWKTSAGFKIRSVGINITAADAAGINSELSMVTAMALSGGLAALAGITEVVGKYYRFIEGFSPSFGFTGIAVAVLGRNHPFGIIITALLFGILDTGALRMSRVTMVSSNMVIVIQSLVILFVAAPELIRAFSKRKVS